MEFIPFLAFSRREQDAIAGVLARAGIATHKVCVSRVELPAPQAREVCAWTTVSTPRWCRTFGSTPESNWLTALERELPLAA